MLGTLYVPRRLPPSPCALGIGREAIREPPATSLQSREAVGGGGPRRPILERGLDLERWAGRPSGGASLEVKYVAAYERFICAFLAHSFPACSGDAHLPKSMVKTRWNKTTGAHF